MPIDGHAPLQKGRVSPLIPRKPQSAERQLPSKEAESDHGWYSDAPPEVGKKSAETWSGSLDDFILFDPNFESCW